MRKIAENAKSIGAVHTRVILKDKKMAQKLCAQKIIEGGRK